MSERIKAIHRAMDYAIAKSESGIGEERGDRWWDIGVNLSELAFALERAPGQAVGRLYAGIADAVRARRARWHGDYTSLIDGTWYVLHYDSERGTCLVPAASVLRTQVIR